MNITMADQDKKADLSGNHQFLIDRYFNNQLKAPGQRLQLANNSSTDRFAKYDRGMRFSDYSQRYGRRAKQAIDNNIKTNRFNTQREIHKDVLTHYENMDWYERDSSFDFQKYIDERN